MRAASSRVTTRSSARINNHRRIIGVLNSLRAYRAARQHRRGAHQQWQLHLAIIAYRRASPRSRASLARKQLNSLVIFARHRRLTRIIGGDIIIALASLAAPTSASAHHLARMSRHHHRFIVAAASFISLSHRHRCASSSLSLRGGGIGSASSRRGGAAAYRCARCRPTAAA